MKKDLRNLTVIALVCSIFFFVFFTSKKTIEIFAINLGISFMYTFVMGLGNGFMNDYLDSKFSWTEQTKQRLIFGIIATIIVNIILVLLCNYVNFILIQRESPENFWNGKMNYRNWFFINFALLISAILHAKGFMEAWKDSTRKEVVEQKLIAKSANAQFETLKNQLDPHFLFNSLNVLSALIDENPDQAQRFTSSMSKIYRYVLDQKDKELVTVQEELDFAKTYCDLLKTRFEDSVNFEFDVKEKDKNGFVVPLSLQLLLENCIKHNYAKISKSLNIRVFSELGFLCVENNLQVREKLKEREGIGLSNIVQRYALITEKNVFIEKSKHNFKVKIPILIEEISKTMTTYSSKTTENVAYERAVKRVKELKEFYGNLVSYCIVIPILIFINLRISSSYQWFWFPLFGWGIGLAIQGLKTFDISRSWEEIKINKIVNKNK